MRRKAMALAAAIIMTATPAQAAELLPESLERVEAMAVQEMQKVWIIEEGKLTEEADKELLEKAISWTELLPEDNEHRKNLEVIAKAAEKEIERAGAHLYGRCTITHYCNGPCCCGVWAGGHTASGTVPTQGRTVAHNTLPFGTRVLIEGEEYTVEDRGECSRRRCGSLTNKEALQAAVGGLETYKEKYPYLKREIEFQKKVIEVLEEKEKYRWHDLEKDPDDLPEPWDLVYVFFEYFRYGDYNRMFQMYGTSYATDEGKFGGFVNGESGWRKLRIIAWREIEEFERGK